MDDADRCDADRRLAKRRMIEAHPANHSSVHVHTLPAEADSLTLASVVLFPKNDNDLSVLVEDYHHLTGATYPRMVKFPFTDEEFERLTQQYQSHRTHMRAIFQKNLYDRVDALGPAQLAFHSLSKDDDLHVVMAYVEYQFKRLCPESLFPGVDHRRLRKSPGGGVTWLQRIAEAFLLYLQVWQVEPAPSTLEGNRFIHFSNPQQQFDTAKCNFACIIFWMCMAGDNVSARGGVGLLKGKPLALFHLQRLRGVELYKELFVPTASIWLKCLKIPMAGCDARELPKAKKSKSKLGPASELNSFLRLIPVNRSEFFCNKCRDHGVWSQLWVPTDAYVSRAPNHVMRGLVLPFARMAYMLSPNFRSQFHILLSTGKLYCLEEEVCQNVTDGWVQDAKRHSRFAMKLDAVVATK